MRLMPMLRLAACLALAACATHTEAPLATNTTLDINHMLGRWYVIANIPYVLERGVVGSYVEYKPRPDGDLDEFYSGHKDNFAGKTFTDTVRDHVQGPNNATWRGDFLWPFFFHTTWVYVDPDYKVALLGNKDRSLGWVFSRSNTMDDATYRSLLDRMARQGYDTSKFQKVPQLPQQMGQAGFQ